MTPEQLRVAAKVMEAAAEGKAIEYRSRGVNGQWFEGHPAFDWYECEYRVKPEPVWIDVALYRNKVNRSTIEPFKVMDIKNSPAGQEQWELISDQTRILVRE